MSKELGTDFVGYHLVIEKMQVGLINAGPSQSQLSLRKSSDYFAKELAYCFCLAFAGLLLAFSAPGFDCYYLAWIGLVPFFFAACSSRDFSESFVRGLSFGTAFNLLYLSWCLDFSPLVWPAAVKPFSSIANAFVWLLFAAQQGVLFGAFSSLLWKLPFRLSFLPARKDGAFLWPAFLLLPLLWVLIFNKLGNAQGSISVPWSMIEYSQHAQKELLQIAAIVGGPGIAALIVLSNLIAFSVLQILFKQLRLSKFESVSVSVPNSIFSILLFSVLIVSSLGYGKWRLAHAGDSSLVARSLPFSILQGNMLFSLNEPDANAHLRRYLDLAAKAPAGICVWPEWSMILPVREYRPAYDYLASTASRMGQGWILGALDSDPNGMLYNAVCTVGAGSTEPEVYRKQFLVPFGEYTPGWILKSPLSPLCGTMTPKGQGYQAADSKGVVKCGNVEIGPLLCCELMKPELSNKAVRAGAQVLVDCSNTMWFRSELLGKQSLAICAFRAAETHRSFLFASSIGPSAVIDAYGLLKKLAPRNKTLVLTDNLELYSDLSPFVRWYW
ncbi:MAG: apolipoprotein N-acyltransferase [Candidatus Obscuribacterales bacterium]|nr:apolipoprotein N-acyltransferase [Candidatus Obscuribacterales bacterium]